MFRLFQPLWNLTDASPVIQHPISRLWDFARSYIIRPSVRLMKETQVMPLPGHERLVPYWGSNLPNGCTKTGLESVRCQLDRLDSDLILANYVVFTGILEVFPRTLLWFSLFAWWRHQMETFSALLTICAGNSSVTVEFPTQRPVTRSFDVFFYLCLNKRLNKQSWGWWFETPLCPLWRHCNVIASRPVSTVGLISIWA